MKVLLLAWVLLGFVDASQASETELIVPYHYPKSRAVSVNVPRLGFCMAMDALRYPVLNLNPYGVKFKKLHFPEDGNFTHAHPYPLPDILSYLAGKAPRPHDWATGTESELKLWILSQSDNSIDPLDAFSESLRLNGGNLFNAALALYELLRNESRWWDFPRYQYPSSAERQRQFFDKFVDIRGDLRERGASYVGDHAGSWYRFWGTMLYRFSFVADKDFQYRLDRARRFDRPLRYDELELMLLENGTMDAIVFIEEGPLKWLAPVMGAPIDPDRRGKAKIDRMGSDLAFEILYWLWNSHLRYKNWDQRACQPGRYFEE